MRGVVVLGLLIPIFLIVFIAGVYAQDESLSFIDENAELQQTEGITPDSIFYGLDTFFDRFSDALKVREEKIAEIKAMIEKENYEAARVALERYKEYAENFEREVSPEQRDEARRSAAAIYNVLKSFENKIPDDSKEEFFDDIIEREERIVTAAEIASKIKDLCETLSELDPLEYSRICKTDEGSPKWQKDLHEDLTDEQRKEAEAFFEIMSQCFETSGETCRCEDISITTFADKCSVIAPLAYACDVEDDEVACDRMDAIEEEEPIEDLLPDYLKEILSKIEGRYDDAQFENHAPRECVEAGAMTREECGKIMFKLNAPPECVESLERGEIDISNERESREVCENLMFELEAPFECKEAGLTDFRECGMLMFKLNAPQECIDAGLTGEYRSDEGKCRDIVGDFREGRSGGGPIIDFNCREIQNAEERLDCYDNVLTGVEFKRFESEPERDFQEHEFPEPCQEAGAFTRESCERVMVEWGERQREIDREKREVEFFEGEEHPDQDPFLIDPQLIEPNPTEEPKITDTIIEPTEGTSSIDSTIEEDNTISDTTDDSITGGDATITDTTIDDTTTEISSDGSMTGNVFRF